MKHDMEQFAIGLRAEGLSYRKIAERMGVSRITIARFFGENRSVVTKEQILEARILRGLGVDYVEIAKRVGIAVDSVLPICERVQVVGRYVPSMSPRIEPNDEKAKRLRLMGYPIYEIAAHLGMSRQKLIKLLDGVRPPELPPLPPRGKLPKP